MKIGYTIVTVVIVCFVEFAVSRKLCDDDESHIKPLQHNIGNTLGNIMLGIEELFSGNTNTHLKDENNKKFAAGKSTNVRIKQGNNAHDPDNTKLRQLYMLSEKNIGDASSQPRIDIDGYIKQVANINKDQDSMYIDRYNKKSNGVNAFTSKDNDLFGPAAMQFILQRYKPDGILGNDYSIPMKDNAFLSKNNPEKQFSKIFPKSFNNQDTLNDANQLPIKSIGKTLIGKFSLSNSNTLNGRGSFFQNHKRKNQGIISDTAQTFIKTADSQLAVSPLSQNVIQRLPNFSRDVVQGSKMLRNHINDGFKYTYPLHYMMGILHSPNEIKSRRKQDLNKVKNNPKFIKPFLKTQNEHIHIKKTSPNLDMSNIYVRDFNDDNLGYFNEVIKQLFLKNNVINTKPYYSWPLRVESPNSSDDSQLMKYASGTINPTNLAMSISSYQDYFPINDSSKKITLNTQNIKNIDDEISILNNPDKNNDENIYYYNKDINTNIAGEALSSSPLYKAKQLNQQHPDEGNPFVLSTEFIVPSKSRRLKTNSVDRSILRDSSNVAGFGPPLESLNRKTNDKEKHTGILYRNDREWLSALNSPNDVQQFYYQSKGTLPNYENGKNSRYLINNISPNIIQSDTRNSLPGVPMIDYEKNTYLEKSGDKVRDSSLIKTATFNDHSEYIPEKKYDFKYIQIPQISDILSVNRIKTNPMDAELANRSAFNLKQLQNNKCAHGVGDSQNLNINNKFNNFQTYTMMNNNLPNEEPITGTDNMYDNIFQTHNLPLNHHNTVDLKQKYLGNNIRESKQPTIYQKLDIPMHGTDLQTQFYPEPYTKIQDLMHATQPSQSAMSYSQNDVFVPQHNPENHEFNGLPIYFTDNYSKQNLYNVPKMPYKQSNFSKERSYLSDILLPNYAKSTLFVKQHDLEGKNINKNIGNSSINDFEYNTISPLKTMSYYNSSWSLAYPNDDFLKYFRRLSNELNFNKHTQNQSNQTIELPNDDNKQVGNLQPYYEIIRSYSSIPQLNLTHGYNNVQGPSNFDEKEDRKISRINDVYASNIPVMLKENNDNNKPQYEKGTTVQYNYDSKQKVNKSVPLKKLPNTYTSDSTTVKYPIANAATIQYNHGGFSMRNVSNGQIQHNIAPLLLQADSNPIMKPTVLQNNKYYQTGNLGSYLSYPVQTYSHAYNNSVPQSETSSVADNQNVNYFQYIPIRDREMNNNQPLPQIKIRSEYNTNQQSDNTPLSNENYIVSTNSNNAILRNNVAIPVINYYDNFYNNNENSSQLVISSSQKDLPLSDNTKEINYPNSKLNTPDNTLNYLNVLHTSLSNKENDKVKDSLNLKLDKDVQNLNESNLSDNLKIRSYFDVINENREEKLNLYNKSLTKLPNTYTYYANIAKNPKANPMTLQPNKEGFSLRDVSNSQIKQNIVPLLLQTIQQTNLIPSVLQNNKHYQTGYAGSYMSYPVQTYSYAYENNVPQSETSSVADNQNVNYFQYIPSRDREMNTNQPLSQINIQSENKKNQQSDNTPLSNAKYTSTKLPNTYTVDANIAKNPKANPIKLQSNKDGSFLRDVSNSQIKHNIVPLLLQNIQQTKLLNDNNPMLIPSVLQNHNHYQTGNEGSYMSYPVQMYSYAYENNVPQSEASSVADNQNVNYFQYIPSRDKEMNNSQPLSQINGQSVNKKNHQSDNTPLSNTNYTLTKLPNTYTFDENIAKNPKANPIILQSNKEGSFLRDVSNSQIKLNIVPLLHQTIQQTKLLNNNNPMLIPSVLQNNKHYQTGNEGSYVSYPVQTYSHAYKNNVPQNETSSVADNQNVNYFQYIPSRDREMNNSQPLSQINSQIENNKNQQSDNTPLLNAKYRLSTNLNNAIVRNKVETPVTTYFNNFINNNENSSQSEVPSSQTVLSLSDNAKGINSPTSKVNSSDNTSNYLNVLNNSKSNDKLTESLHFKLDKDVNTLNGSYLSDNLNVRSYSGIKNENEAEKLKLDNLTNEVNDSKLSNNYSALTISDNINVRGLDNLKLNNVTNTLNDSNSTLTLSHNSNDKSSQISRNNEGGLISQDTNPLSNTVISSFVNLDKTNNVSANDAVIEYNIKDSSNSSTAHDTKTQNKNGQINQDNEVHRVDGAPGFSASNTTSNLMSEGSVVNLTSQNPEELIKDVITSFNDNATNTWQLLKIKLQRIEKILEKKTCLN